MVSFVCDTCQETVKKNKVQNHCFKCRDCWVLSCVDCGVRFQGEEYQAHTSCLSEAEKYQGALFQPKLVDTADPQTRWMYIVQACCTNDTSKVGPAAQKVMEQLSDYDNVPRKQAKFKNFLNNSFRLQHNSPVVTELWNLFQKSWDDNKKPSAPPPSKKVVEETKDEKKEDDGAWQKKTRSILKKADSNEMKIKTLKSLLAEKEFNVQRKNLKSYLRSCPGKFLLKEKTVKLLIKSK